MPRVVRSSAVLAALAVLAAGCGWVSRSVPIADARVSPDGLTLEISTSTCEAELTVEVTEDFRSVSVLVLARNQAGEGCADTIATELENPLGERRLIDRFDFTEVEVAVDETVGGPEPAGADESGGA